MKKLKILVACEESQAVTKELRLLGHNAYSCDLLPCSGAHPEWHFNCDVFSVIKNRGGKLQNGKRLNSNKPWDMMIAHPHVHTLLLVELNGTTIPKTRICLAQ